MHKQSEGRTLFTWFIEIIFWIKTFLSPVFGGIYLANQVWETQGTSNFQSKIMATPDLDDFNIPKSSSKDNV